MFDILENIALYEASTNLDKFNKKNNPSEKD